MKWEIKDDSLSNLKELIETLTEKPVLEGNDDGSLEGFYLSSRGVKMKNGSLLSEREETFLFYEKFEIIYSGTGPYNEIKKLFVLLNSVYGADLMKKFGFGWGDSTLATRADTRTDGDIEVYSVQLEVNYHSSLKYEEGEDEYIFRYEIVDQKLHEIRKGEIE